MYPHFTAMGLVLNQVIISGLIDLEIILETSEMQISASVIKTKSNSKGKYIIHTLVKADVQMYLWMF